MNKVTVKRIVPLEGNPFFRVDVNGEIYTIYEFSIDAKEDDIYNEQRNRDSAMKLAEKLEKGNQPTEEIIYQTPKTN